MKVLQGEIYIFSQKWGDMDMDNEDNPWGKLKVGSIPFLLGDYGWFLLKLLLEVKVFFAIYLYSVHIPNSTPCSTTPQK